MKAPLRSPKDDTSIRRRVRRRASVRPLVAALGLSLLGFLAVGLAGPRLATAAGGSCPTNRGR